MNTTDKQRKAMVVGLGKTGLSAARYLARQGYSVAVTDSRDKPPSLEALREQLPDVAVFVGGFSELALANADVVVVSPGVPLQDPFIARARETGAELVGDVELFARVASRPVVAVTGSNGKSTVATLVALMAEEADMQVGVGGNLGTPALDLLADENNEIYVLELSSFQLESTYSLRTSAAVVLNVTADHLDWHGNMESYAKAKGRIYRNAGICIFNRDDAWSRRLASDLPQSTSFGLNVAVNGDDFGLLDLDGRSWLARGHQPLLAVEELKLTGAHNHANALAGLALGYAAGLPLAPMLKVLRNFAGLPHRMEWVAQRNGVVFVNDSKGTNVGAAIAAVRGTDMPLVLIAGGEGKRQDFAELADAAVGRVRHFVLIGRAATEIQEAVAGRIPVSRAESMRDAVELAARVANPGDMVLLSPACSSLDMFPNYEARGRAFVQAIQELSA